MKTGQRGTRGSPAKASAAAAAAAAAAAGGGAGAEDEGVLEGWLPGGQGCEGAMGLRPDTVYMGSPSAMDRAVLHRQQQRQQQQQQQQQQYMELLAQQSPSPPGPAHHRPSQSAGPAASPPPLYSAPCNLQQLPSVFYSNLLFKGGGEGAELLAHPSPAPRVRGHLRAASGVPAALAPTRTHAPAPAPADGSPRVRQSAWDGAQPNPPEEGEGLLQPVSRQEAGQLLRSGQRVGAAAPRGVAPGAAAAPPGGSGARLVAGLLSSVRERLQEGAALAGAGAALAASQQHSPRAPAPAKVVQGDNATGLGDAGARGIGGRGGRGEEAGEGWGAAPGLCGEGGFAGASAIARVERALLWQEPWLSVRALGGGLYMIVCAQQAAKASHYLRPTTLLLAAAFLVLVANLAVGAYRALRHRAGTQPPDRLQHDLDPNALPPSAPLPGSRHPQPSNQRRPHGSSLGGGTNQPQARHRARQRWGEVRDVGVGREVDELGSGGRMLGECEMGALGLPCKARAAAWGGEGELPGGAGAAGGAEGSVRDGGMTQHALGQERAVYEWSHALLCALSSWVIPSVAACCALAFRALSGRRMVTTVLVAGALWLGMLLSELDIMGSATFCALLYVTLFTLPATYLRCRIVMDGAVETLLRFLTRLLVSGDRASLLITAATLLLVFACTPVSLVTRTTLALLSALCVLVYTTLLRPTHQSGGAAAAAPGHVKGMED